ncbi:MAG: 1-phosphofructokinase family hexose kinase [Candidatus Sigynarchaeota archaeon]
MATRRVPHVTCILLNPTIDHVHEVEHFKVGGTYKARETRVFPVGKAISVALGLRALGDEPSVISLIGKDEMRIYRASLDSMDISAILVPVEGRTRRNVTIIDTAEHTVTHVRESGFTAGEEHLDAIESAIDSLPRVDQRWIVLSGSIPQGLPDNTIARLIARCERHGFKVFLDSSGPPLKEAMSRCKPWVLKINEAELGYLVGTRDNDVERGTGETEVRPLKTAHDDCNSRIGHKARELLGGGLEVATITMGAAGAILAREDGTWYGVLDGSSELKVVDSVGAGDAFLAGMIHAMAGGLDVPGILVEAISCATAKILVQGAGTFAFADQQRFRPRVHVRCLE